ncbi:hypothetical protein ACFSTC_02825 [Nonomuraea ferruginea]
MLERGRCPFDPPPGLRERRGQGAVQPLPLRNGAQAWLVTGFEEARTVLSDPRFSADKMRHRDATSMQPHEVDAPTTPEPPATREDGFFVFMDPPEHTRLRRLLTGQFTVRRMKALESRVTEIAVEHIEAMKAAERRGRPGAGVRAAAAVAGHLRAARRRLRRPGRVPGAHLRGARQQRRPRAAGAVRGRAVRVHAAPGRPQARPAQPTTCCPGSSTTPTRRSPTPSSSTSRSSCSARATRRPPTS